MTVTREQLCSWALKTVGLEAARKLAEGGLSNAELRTMSKTRVIGWLMQNDIGILLESYLAEQRGLAELDPKQVCGDDHSGLAYFTCTQPPGHDPPHRRGISCWTYRTPMEGNEE